MHKRFNSPPMFLLLMFAAHSCVMGVEIPEGVAANCERGLFADNKYVALRQALVQTWAENTQGKKSGLVGVGLEFKDLEAEDVAEKIEIAFMVMDKKFEKQMSPILGGGVRESGTYLFEWDFLDPAGESVADGAYYVVMNITGAKHGDLLRSAVFPLYLTSKPPTIGDAAISSKTALLEYGGAPAVTFSSTSLGVAVVTDLDAQGNEASHWEGVMGPGAHTLRSDLLDDSSQPFIPGEYTTRILLANNLGKSDVLEFNYLLQAPPALVVTVKPDGPAMMQVDDETAIPFTVTLNQNANLIVEHISEDGKQDYIGESTKLEPAVFYAKGTHQIVWRRVDMEKMEFYSTGKHWLRVTASTLTGEKKTVDSTMVALTPTPKPKQKPQEQHQVSKKPARGKPKISLSLSPDNILIGGRMTTRVKYSFDQDSMIRLAVYDKSGKLMKTLRNSRSEHVDKGSYWVDLDASDFDYANYRVVLEAVNFYGESKASTVLSVTWR